MLDYRMRGRSRKKMDVRSVRLHLIVEPLVLFVVTALLGVVLANFILSLVIGGMGAIGVGGAWAYIWVFARDRLEELGFHW